jgi:plastocyanin
MPIQLRTLLAAAALGAAFLVAPGAPQADNPALNATVGPGFTIDLKNPDGSVVKHLDPGTYTINVADKSESHSFHLHGPGVDQDTEVETVSKAVWTVTFVDGTYTYRCDAHPTEMFGSFTVGTVVLPKPPKSSGVPKLVGSVGAASISLSTGSGAAVKRLKPGSYSLTVHDRTRLQDFHLIGPGVSRKTGVRFVGTAVWKVKLAAGTYRYRSDAKARLSGAFTVKK